MRVLIMGAGAIGGIYGTLLALRGHDVAFVARGAQLEAMHTRGLEVVTPTGTHRLQPVTAVERPADASGPFDLVLFTVKGYDTEDAATAVRPAVGAQTVVLTLQNGVESVDRLAEILPAANILAGATYVAATTTAPGIIDQVSTFRRIIFGEPDGGITPRVETIASVLQDAGIEATASADATAAVWQKFVMQASHATITSVCRSPVGPIRKSQDGAALYHRAMTEVAEVGRASGVALAEDAVDAAFATVSSMPPAAKTSMQVDFERGRRVELEELTGAVVRQGIHAGVPTPTFNALYSVLKVRELTDGSRR
jgi:2-dehydropantoate 2-reductase